MTGYFRCKINMDVMKRFEILFILIPLLLAGCHQESAISMVEDESTVETVSHDMMVLGDQLDDPYSVGNITKAMEKVYPSTKSSRTDITPTDMYIRFLPADEDEFATLEDLGLHLMDHPLDYQIVKDGDYYHDPTVPEDEITWQYAVVPKDFELPEGIRYEILDECYIPSNDEATKSDGLDWDLIEREAFILTGNEDLLVPDTKAEKTYPAGRITIVDDGTTEGTEIGVAGVKVVGNVFVKFGSGYTDRDGYYKLSKKFSSKVRYRIMFKNKEDFCIGMNLILVPASFSALGKGPSTGVDYKVTSSSDRKLFTRCVVNNAAYDYINRCSPDDLNIQVPPKHLRLWIFQKTTSSSSPMLRHGTILENQLLKKYLGNYAYLINVFLPDITIGAKNKEDYATIYSVTCHEMAHASHFAQVDVSFWNKYITYILTSFRHQRSHGIRLGKRRQCRLLRNR